MDKAIFLKNRKAGRKGAKNDTRARYTVRGSMDNIARTELVPTPAPMNIMNNCSVNIYMPNSAAPSESTGPTDEAIEERQFAENAVKEVRLVKVLDNWTSNKNNIDNNIINFFKSNGLLRSFTIDELIQGTRIKKIQNYMYWRSDKSKILVSTDENEYALNPEVIQKLNLN
jgi:hypothetical protein